MAQSAQFPLLSQIAQDLCRWPNPLHRHSSNAAVCIFSQP